jgi:hypothetical protein
MGIQIKIGGIVKGDLEKIRHYEDGEVEGRDKSGKVLFRMSESEFIKMIGPKAAKNLGFMKGEK